MTRQKANGMLLVAAALWGVGNVAQQELLLHIGPLLANGLKSFIGILAIAPFVADNAAIKTPLGPRSWLLAVVTALYFTLATLSYQAGFEFASVTNAGFFVNTCSILTPIAALVLLRRAPPPLTWPSAGMAVVGAATMAGGQIGGLGPGEALCLVSSICYAVWMVLLGEFVAAHGREGFMTILQFAVSGALCIAASFVLENNSMSGTLSALRPLLFVGVVSTGGGYFLQAVAQRCTSASEAAVIVSAEAIFGALAAFVILGETLSAQSYFGLGLIGLAIVLVQLPIDPFSPLLFRRRAFSTLQVHS